jgi:ribose-phosphate pyrophosphokinase
LNNTIYLLTADSNYLATGIKNNLRERGASVKLLENCLTHYADGGTNPNLSESIRGHNIYIVSQYQQAMGQNIWETAQLIRAVSKNSGRNCYVIEPCFRCARGDKVTERGISNLQLQIDLYETAGAKGFVALDLHDDHGRSMTVYPFENLTMMGLFETKIRELGLVNERTILYAPDHTAQSRYGSLADRLGLPMFVDHKARTGADTFVRSNRLDLALDGTTAIILDDICSTGGTLTTSVKHLRAQGVSKVVVLVTHGATAQLCHDFQEGTGVPDLVVVTNSTPLTERFSTICSCQTIDIIPILAETIKIIHDNGSLEPLLVRNR